MTAEAKARLWHRRRNLEEKQADLTREYGLPQAEYFALLKDLDEKVGSKYSSCLEWRFAHTLTGYAKDSDGNLIMRREYKRFMGSIPESGLIHTCGNPGCIRVGHMVSGDEARRQRDVYVARAHKPKPHNRGHKNGKAKLTWADVKEIRHLGFVKKATIGELAKKYNMARSSIADILHYRKWVDPTEENKS